MGLLATLFRFLFVLFFVRLLGIVVRAFLGGFAQGVRPEAPSRRDSAGYPFGGSAPRGPIEELVKDPICGVHTARSSAIVGRHLGATAYFCSDECAAKAAATAAS